MAKRPTNKSKVGPSSEGTSSSELATTEQKAVLSKLSDVIGPELRNPAQTSQVATRILTAISVHRGPLPPPDLLRGYDEVLPGAAREIMDMAIREQRHRNLLEQRAGIYPFIGMFAGTFVLTGSIAGSFLLAIQGNTIVASLLLGAPMIGAVGILINSRLKDPEQVIRMTKKPTRR